MVAPAGERGAPTQRRLSRGKREIDTIASIEPTASIGTIRKHNFLSSKKLCCFFVNFSTPTRMKSRIFARGFRKRGRGELWKGAIEGLKKVGWGIEKMDGKE